MAALLWMLGGVLCFEGLVFALLPRRIDEVLELVRRLSFDTRRLIGLATMAAGLALFGLARMLGA